MHSPLDPLPLRLSRISRIAERCHLQSVCRDSDRLCYDLFCLAVRGCLRLGQASPAPMAATPQGVSAITRINTALLYAGRPLQARCCALGDPCKALWLNALAVRWSEVWQL